MQIDLGFDQLRILLANLLLANTEAPEVGQVLGLRRGLVDLGSAQITALLLGGVSAGGRDFGGGRADRAVKMRLAQRLHCDRDGRIHTSR